MLHQLYIDKNGVRETIGNNPASETSYKIVAVTICRDENYCGYVDLELGGAYAMCANAKYESLTYKAHEGSRLRSVTIAVNIDKK